MEAKDSDSSNESISYLEEKVSELHRQVEHDLRTTPQLLSGVKLRKRRHQLTPLQDMYGLERNMRKRNRAISLSKSPQPSLLRRHVPGTYMPPKKHMVHALSIKISKSLHKSKIDSLLRLPQLYKREPSANPDWYGTILDSYAAAAFLQFNWQRSSAVFTQEEVQRLLKKPQMHDPGLMPKARRTLKTLQKELLLTNFPRHKATLTGVLTACSQLLDARELTLEILQIVQQRDKLQPTEQVWRSRLTARLQALVANWECLHLPYSKFVFESEDLSHCKPEA